MDQERHKTVEDEAAGHEAVFRIANQVRADVVIGPLLDHAEVWSRGWGNPGPSETDHGRSNGHINKFLEYDVPFPSTVIEYAELWKRPLMKKNENCDDIFGHIHDFFRDVEFFLSNNSRILFIMG